MSDEGKRLTLCSAKAQSAMQHAVAELRVATDVPGYDPKKGNLGMALLAYLDDDWGHGMGTLWMKTSWYQQQKGKAGAAQQERETQLKARLAAAEAKVAAMEAKAAKVPKAKAPKAPTPVPVPVPEKAASTSGEESEEDPTQTEAPEEVEKE